MAELFADDRLGVSDSNRAISHVNGVGDWDLRDYPQ